MTTRFDLDGFTFLRTDGGIRCVAAPVGADDAAVMRATARARGQKVDLVDTFARLAVELGFARRAV